MSDGREVNLWFKRILVPLKINLKSVERKHLWQTKSAPDLKFMSDELMALLVADASDSGLRCEKQLV
jgi:hypothetical protein